MTKLADVAKTVKQRKEAPINSETWVSLGSTMLNLALSDKIDGGTTTGKIINVIGNSSSGKTLLAYTMFAELSHNPAFDKYKLVYDDSEQALEMNVAKLFGKKTAERIVAPRYDKDGEPLYSSTVEMWLSNIMNLADEGTPFIYVLDSLDTLSDASEIESADDLRKKADKEYSEDKVVFDGSYGMRKAKLINQTLRTIVSTISNTNSLIYIISQTRDNVNARPGQKTSTRSGGKGLEFYCTHTIWLNNKKTLKAGKKGSEEIIGNTIEVEVSKNKITGKRRKVEFDTYYSLGVDDLTSCVDFLIDKGVFKQKGAYLDGSVLGLKDSIYKSSLIEYVEDNDLEDKIKELCQKAWNEKEEALELKRKPRFADE